MTDSHSSNLNKALFFVYAVFVFASSFSIALAQTALGVSLALFLAVIIRERHRPFVASLRWFYIPVGMYVLWLMISAIVNATPLKSLLIIKEEWLFMAVPIGVYLFQNQAYRRRLLMVLAVTAGLISLYGLAQFFTGVNWGRSVPLDGAPTFGYRTQGNFSVILTFGNYLGTASFFLLGFALLRGDTIETRIRRLMLVVAWLGIVVTMLTFSRGAILACAATLVFVGVLMGRKYWLPMAGMMALLVVLVGTLPGVTERFRESMNRELNPEYEGSRLFIWNNTLTIIGDNPVFGVGQGNFYEQYAGLLREDIEERRRLTHAHNDMLNVAAISGIPGMVFFEWMWLAVFWRFWKGYRRGGYDETTRRLLLAALAGSVLFWISSMMEATFADEEVRQFLMFVWAAGLSVWYKKACGTCNHPASRGGEIH